MDLSTNYLGLSLRTPLVPSASTLSEDLDNIKKMEDAGASAVVFHSLFEEQISLESEAIHHHLTSGTESFAESLSYFPELDSISVGPELYLENIRKAKESTDIPIVASLNGRTSGGWINYAEKIEQAGADALELNIYYLPTDFEMTGAEVEQQYVDILKAVKSKVSIPVAVKLSPFISNMGKMAKDLEGAGADGLVMFNRFYQPDIDIENLEVRPRLLFSGQNDLRLVLCWIGLLYGRVKVDFAATSGIRSKNDALKLLMAGANVTMLCAVLYEKGITHIKTIEEELVQWMENHEYESVKQMQGSISQLQCDNPYAFERAQYMKAVTKHPSEF